MTSFAQPGSYNANVVLTADVGQYSQGMAGAATQTQQVTGHVEKLVQAAGKLKNGISAKFTNDKESIATLVAATAAAATMEKQMSTLASTAKVTGQSMGGFRDAVNSTFSKIPVARGDIIALATSLNQLGVTSSRELGSMTTTFEKLAAVTGGDANGLAASMLSFTRAMGDASSGNVKAMADSLVTLSKDAGLSAQSILDFASAIAPIARVSGVTQAEVLGLATAFSKAGADGYVAANTFNSMLQDITQASATGSPQLNKYAAVLGMTAQQFKAMPKATALADLFQVINSQGQQGITTLNNLGINGVRAITAFQSVAQSGGLQDAIDQAVGSSNNGSLDKGAKAAFGSLGDQMVMFRNQVTRYGSDLGQHFLGPTTEMVKVLNQATTAMHPFVAAFSMVSGLAGGGLSMLTHVAAPLVTARLLARSPIGTGLNYGFRAGRAYGNDDKEAALATRAAARGVQMDPQKMGGTQRFFYNAASAFGRGAEKAGTELDTPKGSQLRNFAATSPLRLVQAVANYNTRSARLSRGAEDFKWPVIDKMFDAPGKVAGGVMSGTRSMFGLYKQAESDPELKRSLSTLQTARRAGTQTLSEVTSKGLTGPNAAAVEQAAERVAAALNKAAAAASGDAKAKTEETTAERETISMTRALGEQMQKTTLALWNMTREQIIGSASALKATAGAGLGAVPGGALLRGGAGALANLGKFAVGNPIGMALTAFGIGSAAWSRSKSEGAIGADSSNQWMNPIQKYNEQLGIATQHLADFSAATTKAADQMAGATASLASAAKITDDMVINKPAKPTNAVWSAVNGSSANALAQLNAMPITDGRQLRAAENDMLATGMSQSQVQSVIDQYLPGHTTNGGGVGKTDYKVNAQSIVATEGNMAHWYAPTVNAAFRGGGNSKSGQQMIENQISGLRTQRGANNDQYGAAYAYTNELDQASQMFGQLLKATPGGLHNMDSNKTQATLKAAAHGMSKFVGGGYGTYDKDIKQAIASDKFSKMSDTELQQWFINEIGKTKEGKNYLADIKASGGNVDAASLVTSLTGMSVAGGSDFNKSLAKTSSLGAFAAGNVDIQNANGPASADPKATFQATQSIYAEAAKEAASMGTGAAGVSSALQKLQDKVAGSGTEMEAMANAAQALAQRIQNYQLQSAGPEAQVGAALGNLQVATNADQSNPNYGANLKSAQDNWSQVEQSYTQHLIQMYQQEKSYNLQMQRADEDYQYQKKISAQNFDIQMSQQAQAYQRQTLRAQEDFNTQLQRQAQSAAESIYNPFDRVQTEYTTDAGTLLQNLQDQNGRIAQQYADLKKLKGMGVTQGAIDTLQLANPQNAQQTDSIVASLMQNPELVSQINASVATRVKATTQLTQSSFVESYRQTQADFKKSMDRGNTDYQTSVNQAMQAQQRSMDQMSHAYKQMVDRSAADLATSFTQLNWKLATAFKNVMGGVLQTLKGYAPDAASAIESALDPLAKKYPMLLDTAYINKMMQVYGGLTTVGGQAAGSNTADRNRLYSGEPAAAKPKMNNGVPSLGGHAAGGLSTKHHVAQFSESNKAELIVPLENASGTKFMTSIYQSVAREVAMQMRTAGHSTPTTYQGPQTVQVDNSTNFTGAITVQSQDPNAMAKALQQKARLAKLSRPPRSTAGAGL